MSISLVLFLTLAGLALWFVTTRPKFASPWAAEVGRLVFFCGMFVLTWHLAGDTFRFGTSR
jgi:hypothetical protein